MENLVKEEQILAKGITFHPKINPKSEVIISTEKSFLDRQDEFVKNRTQSLQIRQEHARLFDLSSGRQLFQPNIEKLQSQEGSFS